MSDNDPIEQVYNGKLAELIKRNSSFEKVIAEQKYTYGSVLRWPDISIKFQEDDINFIVVECKKGQTLDKKKRALKDTRRWVNDKKCCNRIALCYPENIQPEELEASDKLLMAIIRKNDESVHWFHGDLLTLIHSIKDIEKNDDKQIIDIIKTAIEDASKNFDVQTDALLGEVLEIGNRNKRATLISCLIIVNTFLLQSRLKTKSKNKDLRVGLRTLTMLSESENIILDVLRDWRKIQEVDYRPVIDPAIRIIRELPADKFIGDALKILLRAALRTETLIVHFQLDYLGSIYHGLLETAKHDGSFYTTVESSVLLSELSLDKNIRKKVLDNNFKIIDPACGTGTLLLASANRISQICDDQDKEDLHLKMVSNIIHGLDINQHAIHIAASSLTLLAPSVDYDYMNLYCLTHGGKEEPGRSAINDSQMEVHVGSLDLLLDNPDFKIISSDSRRISAIGYRSERIMLDHSFDVVMMNPPYTRNSIRHDHLDKKTKNRIKSKEVEIAKIAGGRDKLWGKLINQSALATFFFPIADGLLKEDEGTLAMVLPYTAHMNKAGEGMRRLLCSGERFILELVVSSHDLKRVFFSGNTKIHETLVIARRATEENREKPVAFVSLFHNPDSLSKSYECAEAIKKSLKGDSSLLNEKYGRITFRNQSDIRGDIWHDVAFYNSELVDTWKRLKNNRFLRNIGVFADVYPTRRRMADAYSPTKIRQEKHAIWYHNTDAQTRMLTTHDRYLYTKKGKEAIAGKYWNSRSNLLIANRLTTRHRTLAIFSEIRTLGSPFTPVTFVPRNAKEDEIDIIDCYKSWCLYLNSSYGFLGYLSTRGTDLKYAKYSKAILSSLLVPDPHEIDINKMARGYERFKELEFLPVSKINSCEVRKAIDEVVFSAIPGLPSHTDLREKIQEEPTVGH